MSVKLKENDKNSTFNWRSAAAGCTNLREIYTVGLLVIYLPRVRWVTMGLNVKLLDMRFKTDLLTFACLKILLEFVFVLHCKNIKK